MALRPGSFHSAHVLAKLSDKPCRGQPLWKSRPAAYSLRWQGSAAVALRLFVSIIERAADRMEKVTCE